MKDKVTVGFCGKSDEEFSNCKEYGILLLATSNFHPSRIDEKIYIKACNYPGECGQVHLPRLPTIPRFIVKCAAPKLDVAASGEGQRDKPAVACDSTARAPDCRVSAGSTPAFNTSQPESVTPCDKCSDVATHRFCDDHYSGLFSDHAF